jgi:predicted nucleotide-binding protein (sugar kinase/HSP70/actin superfamily)
MSPFDVINTVATSAEDQWDEIGDKDYVPFMINRGLSYHHDTIMLAQEMNLRAGMTKRWQYDFYRIAIQPKKKRFAKWAKPDEDALINLISETYQVNLRRAMEIRSLLNTEEIGILKQRTNHGGR